MWELIKEKDSIVSKIRFAVVSNCYSISVFFFWHVIKLQGSQYTTTLHSNIQNDCYLHYQGYILGSAYLFLCLFLLVARLCKTSPNTVRPVCAVTSVKQSPLNVNILWFQMFILILKWPVLNCHLHLNVLSSQMFI